MHRRLSTIFRILILSAVLMLAGCEDASAPGSAGGLESIAVEPSALTLARETAGGLKAVGYYQDGSVEDLTGEVEWTVGGNGVTFGGPGSVQGLTPGVAQVQASLEGLAGSAAVTVTDASLVGLQMEEPEEAAPTQGASQVYRLVGFFSDGSQQELTEQATFEVDNSSVASVSPGGVLARRSDGQATLTASSGGLTTQSVVLSQTKTLSRISLTPSGVSFPKGITQTFKATGVYTDGTSTDLTNLASWRSSNTTNCTVAAGGLATGVRAGTATITATYGGKTGSASVTVNTATLSSVTVTTGATLPAGTTQQLKLNARYSNSVSYDVTNLATFRSASTSVASVTTTGTTRGLVKAMAVGSSVISATFGGKTAQTTVRVTAPTLTSLTLDPATVSLPRGLTRQLTATARFSDNTTRNVTDLASFSSSATAVASVSTLSPRGVVTAKANGSATITASYSGRSATSRVTVVNATLSSIRFEPGSASLAVGTTQRFLVRALFSDGSQQDVTAGALLSLQNPAIAEFTAVSGEVRGRAAGSTTVNASYSGKSASAGLTVTGVVLTRIDVTPPNASLPNGTQQQYTAIGLYSDQSTQNLTSAVQWTASDPSVIAIDASGMARGMKVGSSTITASLGHVSGSVNANVSAAIVTALSLQPFQSNLPKGLTRALTATAYFSDGVSRDVTAEASFGSSMSSVASVSMAEPRGVVTGHAVGSASITAGYQGKTASCTVQVTPAILTSLRFEPSVASIAAGTEQTFLVRGLFSDTSQSDLTSQAVLTLQDNATATVSGAGIVRGQAPGSTLVYATFGGQTAQAELTVTQAVLTRIDVTPVASLLPKGTQQQLKATGVFSDQSTQDLSSLASWRSEDAETCSLSDQGLATALQLGETTLSATYGGLTGQARVTVTDAVVTGLTLAPSSFSLPLGRTQQLTATARYSDSTTRDVTAEASFLSLEPEIVSVDSPANAGLAKAWSLGRITITASYSGQQASAVVDATAAQLEALTVTPQDAQLAKGLPQAYSATGTFSDGTTRDLTGEVSWSSLSPEVAQIDAAGTARTLTPGQTSIQAALDGLTATSSLSVLPAVAVSLELTPEKPTLYVDGVQQLACNLVFSDGSKVVVTDQSHFSSSDSQSATVSSPGGQVEGLKAGQVTFTAGYEGFQANLMMEVVVPPPFYKTLERIATDIVGTEPQLDGGAWNSCTSSNGRFVAFESLATTLVPGDTNGTYDVFMQDRVAGTMERLSIGDQGQQGNDRSASGSLSGDGNLVAFISDATNLVEGDSNGIRDIFLRDRAAGTLTLLPHGTSGEPSNGTSYSPMLSADGTSIVFYSQATNLVAGDTNGVIDIFVYDVATGQVERIAAGDGVYAATPCSISGDGRYVSFTSRTPLVPDDTNTLNDAYVYDRQTMTFERASVTDTGAQANGVGLNPVLSRDGRYVVYESNARNLVAGLGTSTTMNIFLYDRTTRGVELISKDDTGAKAELLCEHKSISADGRFVAYDSEASNLGLRENDAPGDDVFVHDRATGRTAQISLTAYGVYGFGLSFDPWISADGRVISFSSNMRLISGTSTGATSIYLLVNPFRR